MQQSSFSKSLHNMTHTNEEVGGQQYSMILITQGG